MTKKDERMVWTWCGWEPLQFYRRLGGFHEAQEGNALWADDWRAMLDSEACAGKLAEAGINWVTTHLFKGFGLAAEAEEIAATERMIANYHRHGVKVFTYIQYGTVVPETMLAENEHSLQWRRVDWNGQHDGHPYEYGDQYWRDKPCANQPGFRECLLRCVDKAIDIGADGIWIDNLNADGCYCEYCQKAFQAYLKKHITDPWRELGVRELVRVGIPRAERPRDPVFQAWIRFRCEETRTSLRMMAERARSRKPDVVVTVNVGIGNTQRALLENGNWVGDLDCVDYTYAENGLFPGWKDGAMVSQHWAMGVAESIGVRIVPGAGVHGAPSLYPQPAVPNARQLRRTFAESAMLGGHAFGGPYGLRGEDGGREPILMRDADYRRIHRQAVDWYAQHRDLFDASTNAAPIAVLYSADAMIGDEKRSRQAFDAMVQLLQQHQVPFRYALSDRLDSLAGIELLILPHVLPISDEQAGQIRAFVARGGKVLATGRTSLYDEKMRQRRDYALADCLGRSFARDLEVTRHDAILVNAKNGCILLPGEWGVATPEGRPDCQALSARLMESIRHAVAGAGMPEVVSAAPQVGCGWRRLPDGRGVLAIVNYGDTPIHGITVQGLVPGTSAKLSAVDHVGMDLPVAAGPDGTMRIELPSVDVEAFVVLSGRK